MEQEIIKDETERKTTSGIQVVHDVCHRHSRGLRRQEEEHPPLLEDCGLSFQGLRNNEGSKRKSYFAVFFRQDVAGHYRFLQNPTL
jgi:hypothetical protein